MCAPVNRLHLLVKPLAINADDYPCIRQEIVLSLELANILKPGWLSAPGERSWLGVLTLSWPLLLLKSLGFGPSANQMQMRGTRSFNKGTYF